MWGREMYFGQLVLIGLFFLFAVESKGIEIAKPEGITSEKNEKAEPLFQIPNGNFEKDEDWDEFPDDWMVAWINGTVEKKLSTEKFHSGEFSLVIRTKERSSIGIVSQTMTVPLDRKYMISGFFYTEEENLEDLPVVLGVTYYYYSGAKWVAAEEDLVSNLTKGRWVRGTYSFFAPSKFEGQDVDSIRVHFILGANSTVHIDDLELTIIPTSPEEIGKIKEEKQTKRWIQNSSFETDLDKDEFPDAWMESVRSGTVKVNHSKEYAHSGRYSFHIKTEPSSRIGLCSAPLAIVPEKKYQLSAWFLNTGENIPIVFTVTYYNKDWKWLGVDSSGKLVLPYSKGEWVKGNYTFTCPSKFNEEDISAVRITFDIGASSKLYIDNVEFMIVP